MRFKKFGLRTLLIVVSIIGVALGWFVTNSNASRNETRLVAKLNLQPGGVLIVDSSTGFICGTGLTGTAERKPISFPNRIAATFFPQIFERVTELNLHDQRYDDGVLKIVRQFPHLESLVLHNTSITSDGLEEFKKFNPSIAVEVSETTNDNQGTGDPFNSTDDENPFGPA